MNKSVPMPRNIPAYVKRLTVNAFANVEVVTPDFAYQTIYMGLRAMELHKLKSIPDEKMREANEIIDAMMGNKQ